MAVHSKDSRRIGQNLRKVRLRKGMMQIDVAVATDQNRTYISRIETGQARITICLLCHLVNGLEVTFQDLLGNTNMARVLDNILGGKKEKGAEQNV